ncbi:PKD domain-containing protein [Candidatus Bathyarchaeota archaeon]|nr:PKD domain-containing protein [Candidatus Bathyarchaeota archaeon]
MDRTKRQCTFKFTRAGLFVLVLLLLIGSASYQVHESHATTIAGTIGSGTTSLAPASGTSFDYVVTILMENDGYCEIITTSPCNGSGPYETGLATNYSLAGHCISDASCIAGGYTALTHPSEPNYCALFGAEYANCATGDGVCCFQDSGPNLVDRLELAGLTWKAFAEDATNSGSCNFAPPSTNHFPFLYFTDMNTTSRCANFSTTASSSDPEFLAVLNQNGNWPNYVWLTPNNNDNGHSSGAAAGDSYLSGLVPKILASKMFSQRAALFIVYDEGPKAYDYPNDYLYASWSGPVVRTHYVGTRPYSHYSYPKTLETNWGLTPLTSNDASANAMTEFFTSAGPSPISASITFAPSNPQTGQTVSFVASASGGTSPYMYSWDFGDGSSGSGPTASHVYTVQGMYSVFLAVTDSASNMGTSAKSLTVTASLSSSFNYNPSSPLTGESVAFTASVSGGTAPYSYQWNFGDGATATSASPTHKYSVAGTVTVSLTVKDNSSPQQTATTQQTIVVSNPSTGLSARFTFTPSTPQTNQTITYTGNATGGTGPYTFSWSFGDGSTASSGSPITHVYRSAGTFTVQLNVTDSARPSPATVSSLESISVSSPPRPLVASIAFDPSAPVQGTTISFTVSVSGGTLPYSFNWDFGDGSMATDASPTHAFTSPGAYTVGLTINDSGSPSQSTSVNRTIDVAQAPSQPSSPRPSTLSPFILGVIAGAIVAVSVGGVVGYRARGRRSSVGTRVKSQMLLCGRSRQ